MKKQISRIVCMALALVMLLIQVPVIRTHAEETVQPQVWTDDFSSGKGSSYTAHGYWWNMDGVLTAGDPNAVSGVSYYWLNDYVWDDFVMEFDVINQTAQFGVIFRAQTPGGVDCQNQGYGILYDTSWAFFMAENGKFTNFDGMKTAGNASAVEGVATAAQPGTQNAHWKIVAKGERIEVYFNGATTPSMAMDANLWSSGVIGFRTWSRAGEVTAVIDNLTITQILPEPEPEPEPTPSVQTWTDDFSSGKGDHYTPHGWWWNMDGVLTVGDERAGKGVCYYWLKDYVWDDFVMEFDVINQTSEFGVIFRAQQMTANDCQNYGYGVLSDGAWAFFMAEKGGWNGLSTMISNGDAMKVGNYATVFQPGAQNVHWKIVAKGDRIAVYFNGATTPSMMIKSDLWKSGYIGFRTNNPGGAITAVVDNLSITKLTDTAEPENTFTWTDDFSSGKGDHYTPHGYWWNMEGQLTAGDENAVNGVSYYWLKDYIWKDFTMEFDVLNQSAQFGVIFRAQKTGGVDCQNYGYGVLSDTDWAFFLAENGKWSGLDTLIKDGYAAKVDGRGWAAQPGTQNVHWKIVAKGDRIEVYFNHSSTPAMTMDATLYESGYIGFRTWSRAGEVTAVVDNLTITGTITNDDVPEEEDPVKTIEAFGHTWIPYGGTWTVENQGQENEAITVTGDGTTPFPKLISAEDYKHFVIEADLVGVKNGGMVFRSGNPTVGADGFDGFFMGHDSSYAYCGRDNGAWKTLEVGGPIAPAASPVAYSERMHWKLVVAGNTYSLYLDDMTEPLIQLTDNTFLNEGGVGLRILAEKDVLAGRIENLTITPIAEEDVTYTTDGLFELWTKRLVYHNPAEENQGKIIMMGHSFLDFWENCNTDLAPYEILNFGMGGSWVKHIAGKNDMMLVPYNPKAVIVATGGNDFGGGVSAEQVIADVEAYIESLRADLPGVPIICQCFTISPASQSVEAERIAINEELKAWCETKENVWFLDTNSVTTFHNTEDIWQSDNIHLNAYGYQQVAPLYLELLDKIFAPDEPVDPNPDDPNPDDPNPDDPDPDDPNPDDPNPDDPNPDDPNPDDPNPDDPNPDDPDPDDPNPDDPDPDDPDPDDPDEPVVPSKPIKTWTDDFSSDKGGFYTPYGYWWNMDGKLTVGDANAMPGVCYYWLPGMVWDDFVMEFDVDSQSSEFGVILRAQKMTPDDCQNQGIGVLSDTAWAFFMAEDGSFKTFDQLKAEGKASSVGNYPWACQPGSKNVHWKIVAKGDTVSVYFNHASTPSMVMKTSLWKSGYIGFRTNNPGGAITAVVDNLTITNSDVPNTSDTFSVMMPVMLVGSAAALAVLVIARKRKTH